MKKDKLLRRLSAMQFAMWEMREFLDTHPNCPDAKALYRDYLGKPLGEKSHHLLHTDHLAWEMPQAQRGQ